MHAMDVEVQKVEVFISISKYCLVGLKYFYFVHILAMDCNVSIFFQNVSLII
jgi:hypothetical protein